MTYFPGLNKLNSGIAKYANLTAIQTTTIPNQDDLAIAQDTGKIYQYRAGIWSEMSGGSGISKYDNFDAIKAVANPEAEDLAVALDTGIVYQYHNNKWDVLSSPTGASTNWVLVGSKKYTNSNPNDTWDISNCSKVMIVARINSNTASSYIGFDNDFTAANYKCQFLAGAGSTTQIGNSTTPGITVGFTNNAPSTMEVVYDKATKQAFNKESYTTSAVPTVEMRSYNYVGSGVGNTVSIKSAGNITGTIEVYKWQEIKPVNVASYQLIKEYDYVNQIANDNLIIDGDIDDTIMFTTTNISGENLYLRFNNDNTTNYSVTDHTSATATTSVGSTTSVQTTIISGYVQGHMFLKQNGLRRQVLMQGSQFTSSQVGRLITCSWGNTASKISSIQINSNGANTTSNIKIYKLVTAQLVKQINNPIELVLNKTYTNSAVSETIDMTDCDSVDFEFTTNTSLATAGFIFFNGDTTQTNYLQQLLSGNGSTVAASAQSVAPSLFAAGLVTQTIKGTIFKNNKTVQCYLYGKVSSGSRYIQQHGYEHTVASSMTSLLFSCASGCTGKLKIWKKY